MPPKPYACPSCTKSFATLEAMTAHVLATHRNPAWAAAQATKEEKRTASPICPACGKPALITPTRFGPRADCCGLRSWGLKPLVDRATMAARQQAHAAFDGIWINGTISRGDAYRRLQTVMGMSAAECHIAQMTADQALRVVALVRAGALTETVDA